MAACAARGISIAFMTENGRFLARVEGRTSGNVLLRRDQFRKADDPAFATEVSRSVVAGKVTNQRALLRRLARDRPQFAGELTQAANQLSRCLGRLPKARDVAGIRGIEGESANWYFGALAHGVVDEGMARKFMYRMRRPPPDPMNCLLSFLYTLLCNDVRSALEAVGLDPQVGFLHVDRPGRPSLALDMMEELRAPVADRLALALLNRRQLTAEDFVLRAGGCELKEESRKRLLSQYQQRKAEEITHPITRETLPIGSMMTLQARMLSRVIRGELHRYPPLTFT